jgi:ATP-dependent protease ClpP protease subunit
MAKFLKQKIFSSTGLPPDQCSPEEHQNNTEFDVQGLLDKLKEIGVSSQGPIFLVGDITEPNFGFFMAQLSKAELEWSSGGNSDLRDVTIRLASPGGSIGMGFAIHDLIKNSPLNLTVEAYGYACSAAVLPLMAAEHRRMSKYTRLMLHEAFVSIEDMALTKKGLMSHRVELNILFNNYCKILANRSGLKISKIKELCEKETYLSANEALKLNLIDEIL